MRWWKPDLVSSQRTGKRGLRSSPARFTIDVARWSHSPGRDRENLYSRTSDAGIA
jgi:hypothetical protein